MTLYNYYGEILRVAADRLEYEVKNTENHLPYVNDVRKAVITACDEYIANNKPDTYESESDFRVAVGVICRNMKCYAILVTLGAFKIRAKIVYHNDTNTVSVVIDQKLSSLKPDPIIK